MKDLSRLDILLCGIGYTGRTETLEDYFKDKVNSLVVIALSSCFLKENLSSCRVYKRGALESEFKLANFRIKDYRWYRQPLVIIVIFTYWASICLSLLRLKNRYDIYIGASYSFALLGALLKKLNIVKSLIYYSLDYYIPTSKLDFNTISIRLLNIIDRFTVRSADYVWDVSSNIAEYRLKIAKIKVNADKHAIMPLGYSRRLRRFKPMSEINRWEIGFVGSINPNQGLQLLLEAIPGVLRKFSQVRVTIIGQGPFSDEFKNMVYKAGLSEYFNFLGFIKDEDKMLDILSGCAIGVALYSDSLDNKNIVCADPGKTKLYAFCGLPVITTRFCIIGEEITRNKAGIIIDYKREGLEQAIFYLMNNDERLKEFRDNSFNLGENFISDKIFSNAVEKINLENILN